MLFLRRPPITNYLGFLKADFRTVVRGAKKWLGPHGYSRPCYFSASLDEALDKLFPMTGWRVLVVETLGGWTSLFEDKDDVPQGPVGHLASELKCEGAIGMYHPDNNGMGLHGWGGVQLWCYADHATEFLNNGRSISVTNSENGWQFHENAEPFLFENTERYLIDERQDRFTVDMLIYYMEQLGIDISDPSAFGPRCALFDVPPDVARNKGL